MAESGPPTRIAPSPPSVMAFRIPSRKTSRAWRAWSTRRCADIALLYQGVAPRIYGFASVAARRQKKMDMLSGVLRSLRLNASIYCAMDLSAPWGLSLPRSAWAPFHLVESGSCWLLTGKDRRVRLEPGDLVVLFNAEGHTLCDVPSSRPDPLERVLQHKGAEGIVRFGGGGSLTRIVCGKFALDSLEGAPGSLRHLPNLLHIRRGSWPQFASFSATLRLLAREVRSAPPRRH